MKRIRLLLSIAFGCFWLLGLAGCDRAETPPPEPKVVRKKIAPPPENLARGPASEEISEDVADSPSEPSTAGSEPPPDALARADAGAEPSQEAAPETEASAVSSEGEEAGESESDTGRADGDAADSAEPAEAGAPARGEEAETAAAEAGAEGSGNEEPPDSEPSELFPLPSDSERESGGRLVAYAPGDRVDPFEPLFREEPERREEEEETEEAETPQKPQRRLTPLERLDLSQLKLVGIIRAPSGDRALVEEASGKGYIITRGTYIGIHSGQVVEIREDGIIVEEKHEDMYGDVNIRRRELKFQRPSGDEIL